MQYDFDRSSGLGIRLFQRLEQKKKYLEPWEGPEYYDRAADIFMSDLFGAVDKGKIAPVKLAKKIRFHVFTLSNEDSHFCWICKHCNSLNETPIGLSPDIYEKEWRKFIDAIYAHADGNLTTPVADEIEKLEWGKLVKQINKTLGPKEKFEPGYVEISKTLVEHFSYKEDQDKIRRLSELGMIAKTDIHALVCGNMLKEVCDLLRADPVLINLKNKSNGRTPIFYARTVEMFDLLILFKPDLTITDGSGDPFNYFYDRTFGGIGVDPRLAKHSILVTLRPIPTSDLEKGFGFHPEKDN